VWIDTRPTPREDQIVIASAKTTIAAATAKVPINKDRVSSAVLFESPSAI
jgi:hypothetical protein